MLIGNASDLHKLVAERPNLSATVPIEPGKPILLSVGDEVVSPSETASAHKYKTREKCTVQESNLPPPW